MAVNTVYNAGSNAGVGQRAKQSSAYDRKTQVHCPALYSHARWESGSHPAEDCRVKTPRINSGDAVDLMTWLSSSEFIRAYSGLLIFVKWQFVTENKKSTHRPTSLLYRQNLKANKKYRILIWQSLLNKEIQLFLLYIFWCFTVLYKFINVITAF